MKEKIEILWAYEYKDTVDQIHTVYRTGTNTIKCDWPNHSCKQDDLDLFYFKPKLIHYLEAVAQPLPFVFPVSLRYFIGGHSTSLSAYRRQISAFDWIPEEIRDACRRGQCVLYFEDRYEGYPDWRGSQVKYFTDLAKRLRIPTNRLVVSSGNAKMPAIADAYNTGIQFVHEDWFRTEFWDRKIYYNKRLEHKLGNKDKLYLCYNRHWNDNRQYFVYELWKNKLLECGLVSLPAATDSQRHLIKHHDYWKHWVPNMIDAIDVVGHIDEYLKELPLILDNPTFENRAHQSNNDHYLQSYISIVTETWGDNTSAFFSEKIYKTIMAEHPFMVLACQHFLKHLRSVGFKTFDGILDESYDEEPMEGNRARMIVSELKKISNKSKSELIEFWQQTAEITAFNRSVLESDPEYGKNLCDLLINKYNFNGANKWSAN